MLDLLISFSPIKSAKCDLILQKRKLISDNKFLEFEVYKVDKWFWFSLSTDYKGSDHAGPELSIALAGIEFLLCIVDRRHWDYENNRWLEEEYFE